MANYASYKKVNPDQIPANELQADNFQPGAGNNLGVLVVGQARGLCCQQCANDGGCVCQACGVSCSWTVPAGTSRATFEVWSGGGSGGGGCQCCCCKHSLGGAGGTYAIKSIPVSPGDTYTICAGGTYRCSAVRQCVGGMGCASYVTGPGLSNFCAQGGCSGWVCEGDAWGPRTGRACANCGCCGCGFHGADFGIMGTVGMRTGGGGYNCRRKSAQGGNPPVIGQWGNVSASEAWCSCACYIKWPAGGGMSAVGTYGCYTYANCCNAGGQGGSGIVKVTFA